MKDPITISGLAAAIASIIGKLAYFFFLAPHESYDTYTRFFYLFCLLLGLFIGLREWKTRNKELPFTEDVKSGMKIVSIYAIIISAFTWIYYAFINPSYFELKIAEMLERSSEASIGEAELEQIRNTAEFIFNPFTHSTITLFGIIVLGFFYTLILALLFRSKPSAFRI